MIARKTLTALGFAALMAGSLQAQDPNAVKFAATITAEDLNKQLNIVAGPGFEGRETGKKGQKMAAEFIAKAFESYGLTGPVAGSQNPYFQSFRLVESEWGNFFFVTAEGEKKDKFVDFFNYGQFSIASGTELETIFLGYGIDDEKYSDYKGIDIKDKAVVILAGEPKAADGKYVISGSDQTSKWSDNLSKARYARKMGAKVVIVGIEKEDDFKKTLNMYASYFSKPSLGFDQPNAPTPNNGGLLYVSAGTVADIFGKSTKAINKIMDKAAKSGKSAAGKLTSKVTFTAERIKRDVYSENVLGFLEGSDPVLKNEVLVITAHYDHLGIDGQTIYYGADDDGSGTVSVLEIAQAFSEAKKAGFGPKRSILFMTVSGEEKGLLGSEYYSENPVFPIANTIANLNIDMVGRVDKEHESNPNYVYIIGSDMLSSDLHKLSEATQKKYAPDVNLDYTYNTKDDPNRYYYRSDHYNFAKHLIPIIFYFNGVHPDYHKATDTPDKINYAKMEKIGRLIFATAWELANGEKRPVVDKQPTPDK